MKEIKSVTYVQSVGGLISPFTSSPWRYNFDSMFSTARHRLVRVHDFALTSSVVNSSEMLSVSIKTISDASKFMAVKNLTL